MKSPRAHRYWRSAKCSAGPPEPRENTFKQSESHFLLNWNSEQIFEPLERLKLYLPETNLNLSKENEYVDGTLFWNTIICNCNRLHWALESFKQFTNKQIATIQLSVQRWGQKPAGVPLALGEAVGTGLSGSSGEGGSTVSRAGSSTGTPTAGEETTGSGVLKKAT